MPLLREQVNESSVATSLWLRSMASSVYVFLPACLSVFLPVCLSVCGCACLSVCLPVYRFAVLSVVSSVSVCVYLCMSLVSVCLSFFRCVCLSVGLSVRLSARVCVCLFVCLSVCPFVCLSVVSLVSVGGRLRLPQVPVCLLVCLLVTLPICWYVCMKSIRVQDPRAGCYLQNIILRRRQTEIVCRPFMLCSHAHLSWRSYHLAAIPLITPPHPTPGQPRPRSRISSTPTARVHQQGLFHCSPPHSI